MRSLADINYVQNSVLEGLHRASESKMNQEVDFSPNRVTPLGGLGQPEEIASATVFLASDEAAYISGHTLAVAGGR